MQAEMIASEYIERFTEMAQMETTYVDIGGAQSLAVQAHPSPGARTLIVLFHGAINRAKRDYPAFLRPIPGVEAHAHQISIADAGLLASDQITNGWFIGTRATPLQELLPPFLRGLTAALDVDKVVLVGSSGGGFGALYYSWHLPDSVAIVQVPQTNVYAYYRGRREAYIPAAWGDAVGSEGANPCFDLRDIYSNGMENTVIYLQSTLDEHHMANHMAPFIASIPADSLKRIALRVSYWGKDGHSGVVPEAERNAWVRAVISAEDSTAPSAIHTYHLVHPGEFTVDEPRPTRSISRSSAAEFDQRDIRIADAIAQPSNDRLEESRHG